METNYYRNFLAIVEAGNMTTAAQFLHITQPTLSKQLQLLEKEFNTSLLMTKRGSRSIYLTDAGKALYRRAKQICSLEDLIGDEIASVTKDVRGPLRFSISNGRSARLIKKILVGFHEKYPLVRFELYEGIINTQEEQLLNGMTDIGICNTTLTQPDKFEILFSREERLALIASNEFDSFPQSPEINLSDLAHIPLAVSGGVAGMLTQRLGNLDDALELVSVSTTRSSALVWVNTGKVAALIPIEPGEIVSPDLKVTYLSDDFAIRKSVILPKDRPIPHVAKVFLAYYASLYQKKELP